MESPSNLIVISLTGFIVGILAEQFSGWIIAAAIVFLATAIAVGNVLKTRKDAGIC